MNDDIHDESILDEARRYHDTDNTLPTGDEVTDFAWHFLDHLRLQIAALRTGTTLSSEELSFYEEIDGDTISGLQSVLASYFDDDDHPLKDVRSAIDTILSLSDL